MHPLPKRLHIIAFDVPYPADYGGVIDIYHKLESLHAQGVDIVLHMYHYGRKKNKTKLGKFCSKLYYYKRSTYKNPFIGSTPYIVASRGSDLLLQRLTQDNAPILFEGLHCTFHLKSSKLKNRFKIVRTHNIEHHYYRHLEKSESKYFKKYFFRLEAERLSKYEKVLKHADLIAAISPNDEAHFDRKYGNTFYLPAFHSNNVIKYPRERGDFLLYHGNLAVPENYEAAKELIRNVFSKLLVKCVIAGNNPPRGLMQLCLQYDNVELKTNLKTKTIHDLIASAHINVLHTNQNTGIKLKLLNALYRGKFAVVNPLMVEGSGLEQLCAIGQNFDEMKTKIEEYLVLDYSQAYFEKRKQTLIEKFSNISGANKLIEHIDFPQEIKAGRRADNKIVQGLSQLSSFMSYFSL
jgi:hypothetical protein